MQTITLVAKSNPKRPGTKCHAWFDLYSTGMTVAEYHALIQPLGGNGAAAVKWDAERGFITLSGEPEKLPSAPRAKKSDSTSPAAEVVAKVDSVGVKSREELIRQVAAEKGVPVSKETESQLQAE